MYTDLASRVSSLSLSELCNTLFWLVRVKCPGEHLVARVMQQLLEKI